MAMLLSSLLLPLGLQVPLLPGTVAALASADGPKRAAHAAAACSASRSAFSSCTSTALAASCRLRATFSASSSS